MLSYINYNVYNLSQPHKIMKFIIYVVEIIYMCYIKHNLETYLVI